jgi:hypothetical protein
MAIVNNASSLVSISVAEHKHSTNAHSFAWACEQDQYLLASCQYFSQLMFEVSRSVVAAHSFRGKCTTTGQLNRELCEALRKSEDIKYMFGEIWRSI